LFAKFVAYIQKFTEICSQVVHLFCKCFIFFNLHYKDNTYLIDTQLFMHFLANF